MIVSDLINELKGMPQDAEVIIGPRDSGGTWWTISFVMMPMVRYYDPDASKIMRSVTIVTGEVQRHYDSPKKGRKG